MIFRRPLDPGYEFKCLFRRAARIPPGHYTVARLGSPDETDKMFADSLACFLLVCWFVGLFVGLLGFGFVGLFADLLACWWLVCLLIRLFVCSCVYSIRLLALGCVLIDFVSVFVFSHLVPWGVIFD